MPDSSASITDSQEDRPSQPPAYWVFLPGLAVSAYALRTGHARVNGRAAFVTALLVCVMAIAGPLFRALRQTVLASVCAVVVIGSYWALCFSLLFVYSLPVLLFFWAFFALPLAFAVPASISVARRVGGQWAFGAVAVGLLYAVIAAAALQASKNAELTWPRPLDPVVVAPDILAIDKCSQEFAASHPDAGYPESLKQLGPSGTRCLPATLLLPQIKGFTINYEPGAKDSDGRISGYAVKGRDTSPKGADVSSIFTDESGRIHYRFDGPHGKGSTADYSSAKEAFNQVLDCLWSASTNSAFELLDKRGHRTTTDRDEYLRDCFGDRAPIDKRKFNLYGYNFEYAFTNANDGAINGFTVNVRPQQYGISGIRSYLAVARIDPGTSGHYLNIHATPHDRSATLADPMAQPGEINPPGYLSSESPKN